MLSPNNTCWSERLVFLSLTPSHESVAALCAGTTLGPCAVLLNQRSASSIWGSQQGVRASFYRTMMPVYYQLPFAKGQTALDAKTGDSEVISHQRKCLSAADLRLLCFSPVWWGEGVPCCISGIVTCWPVCQHQVTLPSDFSPVRRWTLDFRNVSAFFPLPSCCFHVHYWVIFSSWAQTVLIFAWFTF